MKKRFPAFLFMLFCLFAGWHNAHGLPPVQRTELANGMVLLLSEEHSLPFITIQLIVKAGSKDDPAGKEGVADLTSETLLLGTAGKTVEQINEELDFMGAHLRSSANKDYTTVSLRTLRKDFERAFPLFIDVVTKPTFPEKEVERERARTLAAIQASEDRPGRVAEKAFTRTLFAGGPYGHPTEGTKESVTRLTRKMIGQFYSAHYHPSNCILTVVGDFDEKLVKEYLVPLVEKWARKGASPPRIQTKFTEKQEAVRINRPVTQSNVIIGHKGVSRDNPDYYALTVMNHILGGGGLTSRLAEDIRSRRGLAYSVGSYFDARKYPGSFQVVLQTKNASTKEAVQAALDDMKKITVDQVSEKELEETKNYLVGNFPQRFITQASIVSFWGQVEYYGLGLDYPQKYPSLINSVTKEDVLRVAKTYLHPDQAITVIVADLKEAGLK